MRSDSTNACFYFYLPAPHHSHCRSMFSTMESLYDSLSTHENPHIRLLTLLSAKSEAGPVCCTIATYELRGAPAFESLSYCWGDATQTRPIECNKRPFPVTENLHSALQHLRYQSEDRVLWIDAICINQDDQKERSSQVVLMRDIYRRAQRVLVWLGPSADHSELAYSTLQRLSEYWPEMQERWERDPTSALKLGPYRKTLQRLCKLQGVAQSDDIETDERFQLQPREIAALRAVLERPWWTRLWVVQEVCVSTAVTMICGLGTMSWNDLSSGYVVAMGAGGMLASVGSTSWMSCCVGLYELKSAFDRMQQQTKTSAGISANPASLQGFFRTIDMFQMTRTTETFRVSVPHDKIYGIVGLVDLHPDEEGLSIVPNYELSVVECYKNAALTIMKQSGSSRLLEEVVFHWVTDRRLEGLPSWVPDWGYDASSSWEGASWGPASPFAKHLAIGMMSQVIARNELPFHACPENERCYPRVVDESVLVLEGCLVDTVASSGQVLSGRLEDDDEEKWRLFGEERIRMPFFQQLYLFVNTILRVSSFVTALLSWENLAFADPTHKTRKLVLVTHLVASICISGSLWTGCREAYSAQLSFGGRCICFFYEIKIKVTSGNAYQ
ncbi:HET-domain-containing protein [Karstenula rhodostoma CBS 690.94]|uniref:HET-domain-containing protein n=1 Tax=Karstenula rhodostoma CBS 690.94 TaxID=1392251 RepID=A0A9P4PIA8_9PLEO|nr:HET-domain-containing protein [Karstenula rhodostoma CBS 690.94]